VSERTAISDELLSFLNPAGVVRSGVAIVAVFFLVFVVWAAFAPLESAIISPGVVVANSPPGQDTVGIAMRLRPEDAGDVRQGMTAKIDLSARRMRRLPILTGVVTYVSPRAIEDARTGQLYFLVRLSLDFEPLRGYSDARTLPGMPVQVEIPTGTRTTLDYLLEPIRDVMHNGMREK
jgi:multidrug efflux pump subunit AcrA (membrane-fusion protein)